MAETHARKEYEQDSLHRSDLDPDPIRQFERWYKAAVEAEVPEPESMTVATVGLDGFPSARIVLMRSFDDRGFVFYTDYQGRKGRELEADPRAAIVFHWHALERQIRIEGTVSRTSEAESDAYFQSRPLGSKRAAWASDQSEVVPDRATLEARFREVEAQFGAAGPPRPDHWGGYRLAPRVLEFWQGRRSRLHDRLRYRATETGGWTIERLAP